MCSIITHWPKSDGLIFIFICARYITSRILWLDSARCAWSGLSSCSTHHTQHFLYIVTIDLFLFDFYRSLCKQLPVLPKRMRKKHEANNNEKKKLYREKLSNMQVWMAETVTTNWSTTQKTLNTIIHSVSRFYYRKAAQYPELIGRFECEWFFLHHFFRLFRGITFSINFVKLDGDGN